MLKHIAGIVSGKLSTFQGGPVIAPKHVGPVNLRIQLDEGRVFECDEETHFTSLPTNLAYAPLELGQRLTNLDRETGSFSLSNTEGYEIVRKLGWGTSGSVWLARRLVTEKKPQPLYTAIKFLTIAQSLENLELKKSELSALSHISNDTSLQHPGSRHCTLLKDAFTYFGPHGPHLSLVFDTCSMSLWDYRRYGNAIAPPFGFTMEGIKNITRQVLLGLTFLHSKGVIHNDVKPDNIFIEMVNQDEAITEYLLEDPSTTYPPRIEPGIRPTPITTVMSQPLLPFGITDYINKLPVKLGGFSSAFPARNPDKPENDVTHKAYRAPEIILGYPWNTPVDIWSVGCLIFDLINDGKTPFDSQVPSNLTAEGVHLAQMQHLLGPFPSSFLDKCSKKTYFDETGHVPSEITDALPASGDLKHRLANLKGKMSDQELHNFENFIRRCLTIDPASRPTAEELLEHPWLIEY